MNIQEDIQEIKTDVKEMRGMLHEALTTQAVLEAKLNATAGKVNSIIATVLAVLSGIAYAAWDSIKGRLGL